MEEKTSKLKEIQLGRCRRKEFHGIFKRQDHCMGSPALIHDEGDSQALTKQRRGLLVVWGNLYYIAWGIIENIWKKPNFS